MSIQQATTQLFLEQFLLHPTVMEVNTNYRWIQAEHPNYRSSQKYDWWKLVREHFTPVLNEFFAHQVGVISDEVAQELIKSAHSYASRGSQQPFRDDPSDVAGYGRLNALILHPRFIADPCAVEVMKELKDLRDYEPWHFEMWANFDEKRGYYIKPGFGEQQVIGFQRLASCDELWSGKCSEMHRVLFASVAQALRLIATEQKHLLSQTVKPRMEIMTRNASGERSHEPHCCAAFYTQEIAELTAEAERTNNEEFKLLVERIVAEGMEQTPHCC